MTQLGTAGPRVRFLGSAVQFGDVPVGLLVEELSPLLDERCLPPLLTTCCAFGQSARAFIGCCAAAMHGSALGEVTSIRELMRLCSIATSFSVDFSSPGLLAGSQLQLITGSRFEYPIYVGRDASKTTTAVNPPAKGDTFVVHVSMRRGLHRVCISGWQNPWHGVLALTLDGKSLPGLADLDWHGPATVPYSFPPVDVWVERSGMHAWRFEMVGTSVPRGNGFWLCLQQLSAEIVHRQTGWLLDDPFCR
mmetsp:Transcript_101561/g.326380  ORF Transcript_101561/g.326380 Transcript_101561/m.326380 type:complete len:249 (+) Transcript_101561:105-851(+)